MYPPHRSFHVRIEECIQRYRSRRRLDNSKTIFFNNYLLLGGIDCHARQFQGGCADADDETLEGSDQDYLRAMEANDVIMRGAVTDERYYNPNEAEHWDVDFTGVVSGFLYVIPPANHTIRVFATYAFCLGVNGFLEWLAAKNQ
jgi:hypothetical protein